MILVKNKLRKYTETVHCSDRFAIIRIGNLLIVNVYFPCAGTDNRIDVCKDILLEIESWYQHFDWCHCLIAGDFNCTLDSTDPVAPSIASFIDECSLVHCDKLYPSDKQYTYCNESLNQHSLIDYALVSSTVLVCSTPTRSLISNFVIMDPAINFSDHLPISVSLLCSLSG